MLLSPMKSLTELWLALIEVIFSKGDPICIPKFNQSVWWILSIDSAFSLLIRWIGRLTCINPLVFSTYEPLKSEYLDDLYQY